MADCEKCHGIGLILGERGSRPCPCQAEEQRRARLKRLGIPPAFAGATLAGFQPRPETRRALEMARAYVRDYIPGQTKTGLLFAGSTGTGKTHLAVGLARQLVEELGIEARFVDINYLLSRVRSASFEADAEESRRQIMGPIYDAELVVLDELGGARSNDFVFEVIEGLIGRLYNGQYPVIVTTNALNQAFDPKASQPTLGERIGQRMFSRLQQMCAAAEMNGADWRIKKQWQ